MSIVCDRNDYCIPAGETQQADSGDQKEKKVMSQLQTLPSDLLKLQLLMMRNK
jgi:hypothetical protein